MNLGQFRTRIRTVLGVPSTDASLTNTILTELINEAVQEFANEDNWSWLEAVDTFATVADQAEYAPATVTPNAHEIRSLAYVTVDGALVTSIMPIVHLSPRDLNEGWWVDGWSFRAGMIVLSPPPGSVRTVQAVFTIVEPALTADGDTPLAPARYHGMIAELATNFAARRINNLAAGGAALASYERKLRRARAKKDPTSGPVTIRDSAGWGI